jgi:hypothetical protein
MAAATIPLVLLHESFHALAGRRLGLPSTLTIGRRFYYLVGETRLDSLFSVPKRKRYLPFLAGTIADVVVLSALTLIAGILHSRGFPAWSSGFCLAIAFALVLRLIWQVQFYLETDFYYVISHAMRCPDLHQAAKFYVKTRVFRLLHRAPPQGDADWSDRDQAFARWYAPLLIIGYGFSLFTLLWAGIPSLIRFAELLIGRFTGSHNPKGGLLDALSFVVLMSLQWGLFLYVVVRDRRVRKMQAPVADPALCPTSGRCRRRRPGRRARRFLTCRRRRCPTSRCGATGACAARTPERARSCATRYPNWRPSTGTW